MIAALLYKHNKDPPKQCRMEVEVTWLFVFMFKRHVKYARHARSNYTLGFYCHRKAGIERRRHVICERHWHGGMWWRNAPIETTCLFYILREMGSVHLVALLT